MRIIPFLPGLILALATWILPFAVRLFPAHVRALLGERARWLPGLAPWIHSIALPYLGLLCGWIASRDYGLGGHTLPEWGIGAAAAILLGVLLGRASIRFSSNRDWEDVRDEARWTFYRAAVWPWVGYLSLAVGAGVVASLAEYAWERRPEGEKLLGARGIAFLIRSSGSALLFLLTHNFFLAMLYYLVAYVASGPEPLAVIKNALSRISGVVIKKQ